MKSLILFVVLFPSFLFSKDGGIPSKIEKVTVYLSGAEISRSAYCVLEQGTTEMILTGLSPRIDEKSIQISGLKWASILSMAYDIDHLRESQTSPKVLKWQDEIQELEDKMAALRNTILGLEEEEKVITSNRSIGSEDQALDLDRIKEVGAYYRTRITEIRNEIFMINSKINLLNADKRQLRLQLAELDQMPEKQLGQIRLKLQVPKATTLNLSITYLVKDAGWIPGYDIKSEKLNAPLSMTYKAHVYQKTGIDWEDVTVTLSTGNPNLSEVKPNLVTHYLNFVSSGYRSPGQTVKSKYVYNPAVKKVAGTVTDASGQPLPGCSVVVKGTSQGTQTDFDGYYSLEVRDGQELVFSYLGFKNLQQPIYSSIMNIRMDEDAEALEEVVATGYGGRRQEAQLSSAVSSVPIEQLSGTTPGISIRGQGSLKNIKPPLYIIDGVPVMDHEAGDLDQSEIKSVEVLSNHTALALYGTRASHGVIVITTRESVVREEITTTKFQIRKAQSIVSDGDLTTITIHSFELEAEYTYLAAPVVNENVFLTATFKDWEQHNLLPGEANLYFAGSYAGKSTLDPYTTKKEMVVSLGVEPNISVARKAQRNFKGKSFVGGNRILERSYTLEIKNNKTEKVRISVMDRIPVSQQKEIKVEDIKTFDAQYNMNKGILTWELYLGQKARAEKEFSYKVKYPKYRRISI
ncbi:MAG: mucoidy inhibitor MuiA family protein [Bacteroidota bacterium]